MQGIYRQLKDEAIFILNQALSSTAIKLHSTTDRVKEIESFINKVERKQAKKPFEEIKDIVGVRIICLFLSDIERIGAVVRNSFEVLEEENKVEGGEVSSFGYMSVHFIATMKPGHSGPRYDPIMRLPFEIQVRTIAMDAWANVSHHLDYKSPADVPSDLRRDFYALSGLFYVADRHFEMFFRASETSREKMSQIFEKASPLVQLDQELNLDSLKAYLPKRFPDREHVDFFYSELVEELTKLGYKTIGEVDGAIAKTWDALLKFEELEKERYSVKTSTKLFNDYGAVDAIVKLLHHTGEPDENNNLRESRKLIKK